MEKGKIQRHIKYEGDLYPNFAEEFLTKPGGDTISKCIQCGTCSATCPLSIYMDYTPRRIIAMLREGFKEEILGSFTIWLCASCYSCTVQCPKEIKITDLMYNLKRHAIKEKAFPHGLPIPVLAEEFFKSVAEYGRMSEGRVIMKMYLRTNPLSHINKAKLGFKLLARGRMDFGQDRVKNRTQLHKLLAAMEKRGKVIAFRRKEAL